MNTHIYTLLHAHRCSQRPASHSGGISNGA